MATLQDLLAAPVARAAIAQPQPESVDLMGTLSDIGGAGLGAVASVGNFLDTPGAMVRNLLAGENVLAPLSDPLSDVGRVSGRDLLERWGMRKNKETGIGGWFSDPGEGLRDLAGFGMEIALDPFGPLTKGAMLGSKAGKAVSTQLAGRTHPLIKQAGKGISYIFDKLPEKATLGVASWAGRSARDIGRQTKALFNKLSEGITDPGVLPFGEAARAQAKEWRFRASMHMAEINQVAENAGYHLVPDETLDLTDPQNLLNPRSVTKVRAREDQMRRYLEDLYDPTAPTLQPRDVVSIGGDGPIKEVEYANRTPVGTQVKLVGEDKLYSDFELKPVWQEQAEPIPEEVMKVLDRVKREANYIRSRNASMGAKNAQHIDPYADFFHRNKSNQLRQAEQIGGLSPPSWARRNHESLLKSMSTEYGRELKYKAFKDGTVGINELMNDPYWKKQIDDLDSLTAGASVNGVTSKIIPGYVGLRHVDRLAGALGMDAEEIWEEITSGRAVNKTGTTAYSAQPGVFDVVRNDGTRYGQIFADAGEGGSAALRFAVPPEDFTSGALDDALQFVEHRLATNQVQKVTARVAPEVGDLLSSRGYVAGQAMEDGTEVWEKNLFMGDPRAADKPLMMPTQEFKSRFNDWVAWKAKQVREGTEAGVQPGIGSWKSWTDVRTVGSDNERLFNLTKDTPLTEITMQNIDTPEIRSQLGLITNYDYARASLDAGNPVFVGRKVLKKGQPAEVLLVTPTKRAQVETKVNQLVKSLDKDLENSPLGFNEALYDHVAAGITRNYGDKIDRWMPVPDDRGGIQVMGPDGPLAKTTIKGWHDTLADADMRIAEGKRLDAASEALLRMDDDSLKALMLVDDQIEKVRSLRDEYNEATERLPEDPGYLKQDASIELADRHRALAEELGNHVEKRYMPVYEQSAPTSGYNYIAAEGAVNAMLRGTADFIKDNLKAVINNPGFEQITKNRGVGTLSDSLATSYNPADKMGLTFAEAIEQGFFSGRVNEGEFLEFVRDELANERVKGFFRTEDADELAKQYNTIKSLRAASDTWNQMKTLNEISGMADLPELEAWQRAASNVSTVTKAGMLSVSPATAGRDILSSYVNGVLVGGMDMTAPMKYGTKVRDFVLGSPVDPSDTVKIKEIEDYLAMRNLPSNPQTRAEAFQNFWNAYTMSGSINPNVVTADATRMAQAEWTSAAMDNAPKKGKIVAKEYMEGLKRTVLNPFRALDPRVAGTWTKDELGRMVQRSEGKNPLVNMMNTFRTQGDTAVRAMYVMDRVNKTGSLKDAFEAADKFLLNANPRNFTRFEHKYLKSLFPFYSFMRQSIPLFLGELAANPGGKLGMAVRASRLAQGGSDEYVPYQYQDSTAVPLGQTDQGDLQYLTSFGLMHEDAIRIAGNALQQDHRALLQQALSSANPAIKWLIEHSTNTSLFSQGPMGGRRLDDLDPNAGRIMANLGLQDVDASGRARPIFGSPTLESMLAAGPPTRLLNMAKIATDTRASATQKVLRLISGVRIENVTQEAVTRDLRDRLNALQIASGARPLSIVSGSEKLLEHLRETGQNEEADKLERINTALAAQRRAVAQQEKKAKQAPPVRNRPASLVDMLAQPM